MKISQEMQQRLRCPLTKGKLRVDGDSLESVVDASIRYPIVGGVPILMAKGNSLFSADEIKQASPQPAQAESAIRRTLKKLVPDISSNLKSRENYAEIISLLPAKAKILVVGGRVMGRGMEAIYFNQSLEVVGSDISIGPHTKLISDGHDIPFEDESFDCVIVQAVLEHVLVPQRCVDEIHRVLKMSGIIYSETPFMQQVHMRQYDFTRFTHLGHRRLLRQFEEIRSGPCGGPGMALAWAYMHFLRSFATSAAMSRLLTWFARLTAFYLKYFDYYLIDKPGSYDAASVHFFLGRKSNSILSDRDLISQYKGI